MCPACEEDEPSEPLPDTSSGELPGPAPLLQTVVVSYPRSGSSFLGDLLQSPRGAFYFFEPLHYFGSTVPEVRLPEVPGFLRRMLRCDVPGDFLHWVWDHGDFHTLRRSRHLWGSCHPRGACYDLCFLRAFCRNATLRVAKSIRLPLGTALAMAGEGGDDVPVVHLVRDPRATMHSRADSTIASWCADDPTCHSPRHHCQVVLEDLRQACVKRRSASIKHRYFLLRYEDLALAPRAVAADLFRFLGVQGGLPEETRAFLDSHTQSESTVPTSWYLSRPYTTTRNSTEAAFSWAEHMPFDRALEVQQACQEVIRKLSYPILRHRDELRPDLLIDLVQRNSVQDYCD